MKIYRNNINCILQLLRARILAKAESYFEAGEIKVDESYFGAKRVRGKRRQDESFRHEEAQRQSLHTDSEQLLSSGTRSNNKKACAKQFDNLQRRPEGL